MKEFFFLNKKMSIDNLLRLMEICYKANVLGPNQIEIEELKCLHEILKHSKEIVESDEATQNERILAYCILFKLTFYMPFKVDKESENISTDNSTESRLTRAKSKYQKTIILQRQIKEDIQRSIHEFCNVPIDILLFFFRNAMILDYLGDRITEQIPKISEEYENLEKRKSKQFVTCVNALWVENESQIREIFEKYLELFEASESKSPEEIIKITRALVERLAASILNMVPPGCALPILTM